MSKVLVVSIMLGLLLIGLSGVANANNAVVWYQAPGKSYPVGYNTYYTYTTSSVGSSSAESSGEDNWIKLNATIISVTFNSDYESVDIMVSAVVYSNTSEVISEGSQNYDGPWYIKWTASQSDASSGFHIDFDTSFNSGNNIVDTGYHKGHNVTTLMRDSVRFTTDELIGAIPYVGTGYDCGKFLYDELAPKPVGNNNGIRGTGSAWESFYLDDSKVNWTDEYYNPWSETDFVYGYALYSADTHITWRIPTDSMTTHQLTLSATNIMRTAEWGVTTTSATGASSSVTITIKNGHVESLSAQTQDIYGNAATTFYTKDYTPSYVSNPSMYYVIPSLYVRATTLNNVPVNYKVEWGDGSYSYKMGVSSGYAYTFSHKYYYGSGNKLDPTIKVTAYVDNYYGGWSTTDSIPIHIINNGKMSGGSGACPFLYTYNGTWSAENNVLVWAENATRQSLNTRDYYLFNATEINGKIKVGIGESGADVDYIDAVKLYRVNAPNGYTNLVESYNGAVYGYKDVETPISAVSSSGTNITSIISHRDGNYWTGNKGEYVNVYLNLSKKNLLLIDGIDNPPTYSSLVFRPPTTLSTIWIYENMSGEWHKIKEIKVRHNLHMNALNLNKIIHKHGGKVELRFVMKDRNGIDFVGISHNFKRVGLQRVSMIDASSGYNKLKHGDGNYMRINPGEFVTMDFKGKGNGTYLVKFTGFYFNENKIGKGIGIVRENETNIAEAELQINITAGTNYVLLPLLENYSDICSIVWFIDGQYYHGEKPIVNFGSGNHVIELYVWRTGGGYQRYTLEIKAS